MQQLATLYMYMLTVAQSGVSTLEYTYSLFDRPKLHGTDHLI